MRLSLHSLFLTPVLAVAAAVTPQAASAAVLHVPFAFTVSGNTLPAGDYSVDRSQGRDIVVLTNRDGGKSYNWLIGPGDADPGTTGVAMRFDRTEDGFALRDIRYNSLVTGRIDKKSHDSVDRPQHVIRGE